MKKIQKNFSNLPGWRTNRKIIVIESDDWGSIRMSSKDSFNSLLRMGIPIDNDHYNRNDALESNEDMEMMMELISKYRDSTGRNVVITGVNIVANPNFKRIKENGFMKYEYETFVETCDTYPSHDNVYELWKEANSKRLMVPVFHGREHLNVQRWMRSLVNGCKSSHLAFDNGVTGISRGINNVKLPDYQAAFDIDSQNDILYQEEVVKSGMNLFEKLYDFRTNFFIPTNGPINNTLETAIKDSGIEYLGTSKIQNEPLGEGKYKKHFRYLGKRSNQGLIYLTRNSFFEPSSTHKFSSKDWVNDCLKEIEIAFRWKKPATISSHRVNYIGWLNPENRSNGLKKLDHLLKEIIKKWPNVEFMTSTELGDLISKKEN